MKLGCRFKGHKGLAGRLACIVDSVLLHLAYCFNSVLNVKAVVATFNLSTFCDYEPSDGPSFQALLPGVVVGRGHTQRLLRPVLRAARDVQAPRVHVVTVRREEEHVSQLGEARHVQLRRRDDAEGGGVSGSGRRRDVGEGLGGGQQPHLLGPRHGRQQQQQETW